MDDMGLNKFLEETYGKTIDGRPLFRLIWSTGVTEKRKGTFRDYYGEILIREVTEVRETLKYPFAQDRWILERLYAVPDNIYNVELFTKESYEGIYVFEDKNQNALPLNKNMLEAAMYLFFKFYLQMTPRERVELRMEMLAKKELAAKNITRNMIGDKLRSPYFFVLE